VKIFQRAWNSTMVNASLWILLLFAPYRMNAAGHKTKKGRKGSMGENASTTEPTVSQSEDSFISNQNAIQESQHEVQNPWIADVQENSCVFLVSVDCDTQVSPKLSPAMNSRQDDHEFIEEVNLNSPVATRDPRSNSEPGWEPLLDSPSGSETRSFAPRAFSDESDSANGWESVKGRPTEVDLEVANELDFEYLESGEGAIESRKRAHSLVPPIKQTVHNAAYAAAETNKLVKPIASSVGQSLLTGAQYVGQVLHDTGLDTLDTVQAIPWADLTKAAYESGKTAVSAVGAASYLAAKSLAASPLGQRVIGGIDTAATTAQLKATETVTNVLRGVRDRLVSTLDALNEHEMKLNERLNPHGLPRGEVVEIDEVETSSEIGADMEWPAYSDEDTSQPLEESDPDLDA
jgi:hypothetical protein